MFILFIEYNNKNIHNYLIVLIIVFLIVIVIIMNYSNSLN